MDGWAGLERDTGAMLAGPAAWTGFVQLLLAAAALTVLSLIGFLLAVDPYDTGHTGLLTTRGVADQLPYTANASRGRDPSFDTAIFGNSHVQALKPERLDAETGLHIVSLMMPGSLPREQLAVLDWFVDHHSAPRGVVVGADVQWCQPEVLSSEHLPLWLYTSSFLRYLAGLVQYRSLEAAVTRLRVLAGGGRGRARSDGYWDYAPVYRDLGLADSAASRRRLAEPRLSPVNESGRFPAIEQLGNILAKLPPETRVVLFRPPIYHTALPKAGPTETTAEACRAALSGLAEARAATRLVDLMHDGAVAREEANFYDHDHYRDALAVRIEPEIAAALTGK